MTEEQAKADTLRWDEHFRAGMEELREEIREKFGSHETLREVRRHSRNAMKEMLLAWRSVLDGAIKRIEEADKPRAQRVTKIKIE